MWPADWKSSERRRVIPSSRRVTLRHVASRRVTSRRRAIKARPTWKRRKTLEEEKKTFRWVSNSPDDRRGSIAHKIWCVRLRRLEPRTLLHFYKNNGMVKCESTTPHITATYVWKFDRSNDRWNLCLCVGDDVCLINCGRYDHHQSGRISPLASL